VSLTGKVALVTGGGRGIGRAAATALAARNAAVGVLARTREEIEAVAQAIRAGGGRALPVVCDVRSEEQVAAAFDAVERELGPVDIVVNNAGELLLKPLAETGLDEWRSVLEVNLTGAFIVAREAMRRMSRRPGRIINVGSLAGRRGYPEQGAYCASKHGLVGLTKVMAIEGQPLGIRVHLVSPGGVLTDLSAGLRAARKDAPSLWMTPEEVADAIVFCALQEGAAVSDEICLRRFDSEPWR
jgi:NAD(P)-dependent dehydrogenase (short-subunit alcohol dehydrogenase family)